jgi:N-methylhydantoinase A
MQNQLATPLGLSVEACARGVFEVVTQNMLAATKVHIAERGEDPRKFYLFAFGGAGPAHGYDLARALQMRGVIVPLGAGATSAVGLVTAAVSFDFSRSFVTRLDRVQWSEVAAVFEGMAREGLAVLAEAGVPADAPGVTVTHAMDLRHKGQGHEVTVALPAEILASGSLIAIAELFFAAHREKYGHAHTHLPVELITCRTTVAAQAPGVPLRELPAAGNDPEVARKGSRPAFFTEAGGMVEAPVYDRYRLGPGMQLRGPAIIEERESTVVCGPSGAIRVDRFGALFIDLVPAYATVEA